METTKEDQKFPLIKLAKKLKAFGYALEKDGEIIHKFPLIKLAKKLKENGKLAPEQVAEIIKKGFH